MCLITCMMLGLRVAAGAALPLIPLPPINPTERDCAQLLRVGMKQVNRANNRVQQCMTLSAAHIGLGRDVTEKFAKGDIESCNVYNTLRAWPQCFSSDLRSCEIDAEVNNEYNKCMHAANASRHNRNGAEHATTFHSISTVASQLENAIQLFGRSRRFASDPKRFLFDSLVTSDPSLAARLFSPDGTLNPSRYSTANQLYLLTTKFSGSALEKSGDPLISGIQVAALKQLVQLHSYVFAQMDMAMTEFRDFGEDNEGQLPASNPGNTHFHYNGPKTGECANLEDFTASQAMMERDRGAWLRLVGKCTH